jgi:hypothetical protein
MEEAMTTPIHILSLGAVVQSSTMALMAAAGEIQPMPTAAIFADTQAEPAAVYAWLDWLEKQLPYPVYRVTVGSLRDNELRIRRSKKSGRLYLKNSIPAFVRKQDGGKGLLGRRCTADYKIVPLQRKVKELVGIKRATKDVRAIMWIGISRDEAHRMKASKVSYIKNQWPLIDVNMTRKQCLAWMAEKGYPVPPRSACTFCPFHSDEEWRRLKTESPDEFAGVVDFEKQLQEAASKQETLKGIPYLHEACVPIGDVDLSEKRGGYAQTSLFGNECEGMCGV